MQISLSKKKYTVTMQNALQYGSHSSNKALFALSINMHGFTHQGKCMGVKFNGARKAVFSYMIDALNQNYHCFKVKSP